jgi:cyclohexanecarboxyl-CoA dehydrogenase
MDFELTDTQIEFRDRARTIAEDRLLPEYQARERSGRIDPELRREIGRLGLIAPELPTELGGRGADRLTSGIIAEEIGRGDINVAYLQVVGSLVGQILAGNARPELATEWVPRICGGEEIVGIGSDAGSPRLVAVRDGADWVLNGAKSLSFGQDAAAVVVFARTGRPQDRGKDISAFLVPLDLPGVTREPVSDMGTRAVGHGLAHFADVRVPGDHQLGAQGRGFTQVMQGFDFSRALIGLQCVGCAQQTVDETWRYVGAREAFDRPISKNQGVSFPLAEAETLLSAARLLCYQTLWLKDAGRPHTTQAAMCRWWAPKTAYDVIGQCLLLHGQYGYRTELPIEQRLRDVLGLQIDGTAQMMKLVIARQRLGREAAP